MSGLNVSIDESGQLECGRWRVGGRVTKTEDGSAAAQCPVSVSGVISGGDVTDEYGNYLCEISDATTEGLFDVRAEYPNTDISGIDVGSVANTDPTVSLSCDLISIEWDDPPGNQTYSAIIRLSGYITDEVMSCCLITLKFQNNALVILDPNGDGSYEYFHSVSGSVNSNTGTDFLAYDASTRDPFNKTALAVGSVLITAPLHPHGGGGR